MEYLSLIILIAAIAIGFARKINIGLISIFFAAVLGYVSGQFTGKEIISGFSGSLFITLAGVTLVFAIVRSNNSLDLLMMKVCSKIKKAIWLIPVIFFIFSWLVSAAGPGLIPTAALVVVLAIPLAHATGYNPIMLSIIGVHAADAGRCTMLTTEGNLVTELLEKQGYTENIVYGINAGSTVLAIILSIIVFVYYKGYKVSGCNVHLEAAEKSFSVKQILSLVGVLVMSLLILVFKVSTGLAAFSVAAVLLLLGVADEKECFKTMPWRTILMVTGVGILMNEVIALGGIATLSNFLSGIMSPRTASSLIGLTAGILSWFSSTLGVVMPTLIPTTADIIQKVGGNVTTLEIVGAIVMTSSTAGLSPASTAGALTCGAVSGDEEFNRKYPSSKLFIEMFAWAAVSIALLCVIYLTGFWKLFEIFCF